MTIGPRFVYPPGAADGDSERIEVTFDDRGGVMIEGGSSLIIHPASGTRIRVVTGDEEDRRHEEKHRRDT
jgi:hypothetical protein